MSESGFGKQLQRHRVAAGLTQEELAERAGVSARGISDLERGARGVPRKDTLQLLLAALELSQEDQAALAAAARRSPALAAQGERTDQHSALPVPLTPFIGRETEMAVVSDLLSNPTVRLLTLTGPGGTGKTRLALAVAEREFAHYADGVVFVPLAPLADPALVSSAIGGALGIREEGERPLPERLRDVLSTKQLLLVLDNFEHLAEAAPAVGDLLSDSPRLNVMATSRMPLRLRAEREYPVPPLDLPNRTPLPPVAQLTQYEAVRLFIDRAQAVTPGFTVDNENAPAVAEICWRVDGLPLAIELAAAHVRMLPPQAMLTRLEKRLPLLTGGARDLPARQRTLRETIMWSHDLIGEQEQILFRRLAVFSGGATLEAAEAVGNPTGDLDVFSGLERLVEQNLVRQEVSPTGEPRLTMLETIREFGIEQLAATGEEDATRDRHAFYFLHLAERLAPDIHLLESLEQPAQLVVEYDNLRHALLWFDTHDRVEALLRLTAVLAGEWIARGMHREGLDRIERVLRRIRDTASAGRVQVLHAAGVMAVYLGNHERAAPFFAEALAVAHDVGDPFLLGQAVAFVGWLSYRRGEYQRAEERIAEALRLLQGIPDPVRATPALLIAGDTAMVQEHFAQALPHYQQIIDLNQTAGYGWILCDAQSGLAGVHYCLGYMDQAAMLYAESLRRAYAQHITTQFVSALVGLAAVTTATGHPQVGARLLGAAEGLADGIEAHLFPRDFPVRQRALAALTAALGEDQLAAELAAGRSQTMDQAVAAAEAIIAGMDDAELATRDK
jgi:predicted ATPase/transcriptional regulator with XRE-family HTH domain